MVLEGALQFFCGLNASGEKAALLEDLSILTCKDLNQEEREIARSLIHGSVSDNTK